MTALYRPKIQLSTGTEPCENYRAAILAAGGEPLDGYCPEPDLSCDGLLLCGGGDIESTRFGQEDQGSHPPDRKRDRAELALFHDFFQAGKPILGICRGMQLINVALGGTLIQDLPQPVRSFHTLPEGDAVHAVQTRYGSLLYEQFGPLLLVNSAHHQAVDRLGEGLQALAWAESGFAEAIDLPGYPLLGLQFHPERMSFDKRRPDTKNCDVIFYWFVEAARAHSIAGTT